MNRFVLRLGALAVLTVGAAHAQDFAANWQGSFRDNGEERRVVVQIAKGEGGGVEGGGMFCRVPARSGAGGLVCGDWFRTCN